MTTSPTSPSALALLSNTEKAAVLDQLVCADHELEDRAGVMRAGAPRGVPERPEADTGF